MHNTFLVSCRQSLCNLQTVFIHPSLLKSPSLQTFAKCLAFEKFRNQEMHPVLRANVVDRHQVGMVQGADNAGFLLKAAQTIRVRRERLRENLNGNDTLQSSVARTVDFSHAARAY